MPWSNTIPFPFIVVDPTTGNPIFVIDSTGAHVVSSVTGIDLIQGTGGPPPAVLQFSDLSGANGDPAQISSQLSSGGMSMFLESGQGSTGADAGGSSFLYLGTDQAVLQYQDVTGTPSGSARVTCDYNGVFVSGSSNTGTNYLSYQGEAWNALSYQNGWADLGGSDETGAFRLDACGWVNFKGTIIGGTKTDGTVVANIPAAYRPAKNKVMPIALISGGATSPAVQFRLSASTGNLTCFGISATTTGNLSLEGMRYSLIP
jgi:hypothetical protein